MSGSVVDEARSYEDKHRVYERLSAAFEASGGCGHDLGLDGVLAIIREWEQIRTPQNVSGLLEVVGKGNLHTYESSTGFLSFVICDDEGNPVSGQRPRAQECVDYVRNKIATGDVEWKGCDWIIVNRGNIDRGDYGDFEVFPKTERVGPNALKQGAYVYEYNPHYHTMPKFKIKLGGRIVVAEGGGLGNFLLDEKNLTDPRRVVYDSSFDGSLVGDLTVAEHPPRGVVLAFPGMSDLESEELMDSLRSAGNVVQRVSNVVAVPVLADVAKNHSQENNMEP